MGTLRGLTPEDAIPLGTVQLILDFTGGLRDAVIWVEEEPVARLAVVEATHAAPAGMSGKTIVVLDGLYTRIKYEEAEEEQR